MKTIICPHCGGELMPPLRILSCALALRGKDWKKRIMLRKAIKELLEADGLKKKSIEMQVSQMDTISRLDEFNFNRFKNGQIGVREAYRLAIKKRQEIRDY